MIVLDSDVLVMDLRYSRDARFALNRQALDKLVQSQLPLGITCHTLLEVLGVLTFNLATSDLLDLVIQLPIRYRLSVIPEPNLNPAYAGLSCDDVRGAIARRLAIGDAVTFLQVERFIPQAVCLLTWNARHFVGKLAIPVLTPEEWLQKNPVQP
jgi:hypothetical protein